VFGPGATPTSVPFTKNEPLTETEPVNECVSSDVSPNLVEPLWNNIDDEITLILNCRAFTSPNTVKLFVMVCEPLNIKLPFNNAELPVISPLTIKLPLNNAELPLISPLTSISPAPIISLVTYKSLLILASCVITNSPKEPV
jgi:hypothetical protein